MTASSKTADATPGADTDRDRAVEEQMRADPDARHDLLDPEAPIE
jgi:hypothetical protein